MDRSVLLFLGPYKSGAPYLFSWTGPNGFTSTSANITNLKPGAYTLQVQDDGKCPL
jgi:hypothetical protein